MVCKQQARGFYLKKLFFEYYAAQRDYGRRFHISQRERRGAPLAVGRCTVLQGSVANMIFAGDWFDAVTAFETVYFWPELPQCFREVYRVLKPGGTLLICNESNGDTDKDEKWTEIIGGMTIYKDAELKTYLEQAGFHDVQIHKKKSWLCITARK